MFNGVVEIPGLSNCCVADSDKVEKKTRTDPWAVVKVVISVISL